jgi:hypothetical protein
VVPQRWRLGALGIPRFSIGGNRIRKHHGPSRPVRCVLIIRVKPGWHAELAVACGVAAILIEYALPQRVRSVRRGRASRSVPESTTLSEHLDVRAKFPLLQDHRSYEVVS